jgi:hypothetical protein
MRRSRSYTKSGPGRYHWQSVEARRRFPIARKGGYWKGTPYKTQPEIDRETRERLTAALADEMGATRLQLQNERCRVIVHTRTGREIPF